MTTTDDPDAPIGPATLNDQTPVLVRPIEPHDQNLLGRFHEDLSDRTVAMRYFHHLALRERVDPERLQRVCRFEPDRELVLIVVTTGAEPSLLGVGRWNRLETPGDEAELAVLVADRAQRRGVGSLLVRRLLNAARRAGIARVIALVMPENREMLELCRKFGRLEGLTPGGEVLATLHEPPAPVDRSAEALDDPPTLGKNGRT